MGGELESRISKDTGVSIAHGLVLEALTMEQAREGGNMECLETIHKFCLSSFKYLRYGKHYPVECICWDVQKLTVLLGLSVEDQEKTTFFRNIYKLRNNIAHKEYCKNGTEYYEDTVRDLDLMQAWLDEQNNQE